MSEKNSNAEPADSSSKVPAPRIAYYDQFWDPRTRSTVYRKTKKDAESKHFQRLNKKKPVLVVRRHIDERGRHTETDIEVRSPALCNILLEIHKDEDTDLRLSPPTCDNKLLFHSYPELCRLAQEYSSDDTNAPLVVDIETAIDYIQEHLASVFHNLKTLSSGDEPSISFDLLWAMFRPGTLVYNYHDYTAQSQILLLQRFSVERSQSEVFALLTCQIIKDDGEDFGFARARLKIPAFEGTRKVRELAAYPLSYHKEADSIREIALKRGKIYASMSEGVLHEIDGKAMREVETVRGAEIKRFTARRRVMIDAAAFRSFNPNSDINPDVVDRLNREALTDEQYIICTPIILGFSFDAKIWGGFALDRLRPVQWSNEPFESLVLDQDLKGLIQTLVVQYTNAEASDFDDVVIGKGRGLIGMLAGPPGCGKTLTAEAVAEIARRPLYYISAGELGAEPSNLEEVLEPILALAQRWKAVVLLDEADVFLAQRQNFDVQRNALVAIFLRRLEYYEGILFLTTNLISQCDAAFESRIHFTVHYPTLSYSSRHQIWKNFVAKTSGKDSLTGGDVDVLAKEELNGRQIKNILSVANSVSKGENTMLSMKHIRTVLSVMRDWKNAREAQALSAAQDQGPQSLRNKNLQPFDSGAKTVLFALLAIIFLHYLYLLCSQNLGSILCLPSILSHR